GEVRRQTLARQVTGPRARRMEKGAAGAPGAIHDCFRELLNLLVVVRALLARVVHEPSPAAPDTDHTVSLAQRADRDRTNGGIETGDVAATREDGNGSLAGRHNLAMPNLAARARTLPIRGSCLYKEGARIFPSAADEPTR